MRAKYIGDEDAPGSKSAILFGARRKIGEPFDVPEMFEGKAKINQYVEIIGGSGPEPPKRQTGGHKD